MAASFRHIVVPLHSGLVRNLNAGLMVALVALPLAVAFGESAGLGAQAGITTAIIAGFIAAAFGGSRFQVSGPTGAMTVVLIPIYSTFGGNGVLLVGLFAGAALILAAVLKLGSHIHRLPTSVIEGFTAGIAVVIALQQVGWVFGVSSKPLAKVYQTAWQDLALWLAHPNPLPVAVAVVVGLAVFFGSHRWPQLPIGLLALVLSSAGAWLAGWPLQHVPTIQQPIAAPNFAFLSDIQHWTRMILPALAVAALAALESLLSAKVADRMSADGTQHNSDRELFGQGLANLVVPIFGGVPATAALARTAVNVRAGATSKVAAMLHSVFLLVLILVFGWLIGMLPLAALSGVLLATAAHMIKPKELLRLGKANRLDALILVTTLLLTVLLDLTSALLVGVLLWVLLRKSRLNTAVPGVDQDETLGD